jgi:hypothetical protein
MYLLSRESSSTSCVVQLCGVFCFKTHLGVCCKSNRQRWKPTNHDACAKAAAEEEEEQKKRAQTTNNNRTAGLLRCSSYILDDYVHCVVAVVVEGRDGKLQEKGLLEVMILQKRREEILCHSNKGSMHEPTKKIYPKSFSQGHKCSRIYCVNVMWFT